MLSLITLLLSVSHKYNKLCHCCCNYYMFSTKLLSLCPCLLYSLYQRIAYFWLLLLLLIDVWVYCSCTFRVSSNRNVCVCVHFLIFTELKYIECLCPCFLCMVTVSWSKMIRSESDYEWFTLRRLLPVQSFMCIWWVVRCLCLCHT